MPCRFTSWRLAAPIALSLASGAQGMIWVGTRNGFSRVHNGNVDSFGYRDGLSQNTVYWISEDPEGSLWVGQYRDRKIHQVDPATGAILRSISSDRFVTGVTFVHNRIQNAGSVGLYLEAGSVRADLPVDHFFNQPLAQSHPEAHLFLRGELT